jgi:Putative restriction endonuclease
MATYPVRTRRWTRAEYERLIDIGVFLQGEPLELLGGELIVSETQGSAHYTAIGLVEDALRAALGPGWLVRSQGPIELDDESEPEPNIAVMRGDRRSYSHRHPSRPALVLEVAESSLAFDREHKGSLYARASGRLLERQSRRSRRRNLPMARSGHVGAVRLALRFEGGPERRVVRRAPGGTGSPHSRQRPPALERSSP